MTSRLGTGNSRTFFYGVYAPDNAELQRPGYTVSRDTQAQAQWLCQQFSTDNLRDVELHLVGLLAGELGRHHKQPSEERHLAGPQLR